MENQVPTEDKVSTSSLVVSLDWQDFGYDTDELKKEMNNMFEKVRYKEKKIPELKGKIAKLKERLDLAKKANKKKEEIIVSLKEKVKKYKHENQK